MGILAYLSSRFAARTFIADGIVFHRGQSEANTVPTPESGKGMPDGFIGSTF